METNPEFFPKNLYKGDVPCCLNCGTPLEYIESCSWRHACNCGVPKEWRISII